MPFGDAEATIKGGSVILFGFCVLCKKFKVQFEHFNHFNPFWSVCFPLFSHFFSGEAPDFIDIESSKCEVCNVT